MDIGNIPNPPKLPNLYARAAKIVKALLGDQPNEVLMGFLGYYHSVDQTFLKPNCLTFPSQNCFIPLKDKIVPRAGKTLLGQPFSKENVEIGFDSFTSDEFSTISPISEYVPLSVSTSGAIIQSFSIKIDSTHVLNFWVNSGDADSIFFTLGSISGTFVPGDGVRGLSSGATARFISISGSNYLVEVLTGTFQVGETLSAASISGATADVGGFANSSAYSNAQVFSINPTTGAMTAMGLPYIFDKQSGTNSPFSAANIDGQHFVGFWNNNSGGNAQVFNIAPSTYVITVLGSPLVIDANSIGYNSCVLVDGNHVLNFWNHNNANGDAQVFAINLSTFAVTAVGSPLSFDTTINNISNSCGQVDSTHFINFWTSTTNIGKTQTFAVNLSTYAVTSVGSALTFDATQATYNSCAFIDSTHFINFWNHGLTGLAQTFNINASTHAVTSLNSPIQFSSLPVISNSCAALNSIDFINFWTEKKGGISSSQYAQVFSLDEFYNIIIFENSLHFDDKVIGCNSCVFIGAGAIAGQQLISNFWIGEDNTDFAISGDTAIFYVTVNTNNFSSSHPVSGDNRILFVSIMTNNTSSGDQVTGVTYGGIVMTLVAKVTLSAIREQYLYYLVNPTEGIFSDSDGIVVTTSGIDRTIIISATSYNGVKQSAPTIMSSVGPNSSVTSISISETTIDNESWIMSFFSGGAGYVGGLTQGAGTQFRGGNTNFQMADSGGPISPPAATALVANFNSSTTAIAIAVAFSPFGGVPQDKNWPIIGHKKRFTNEGGYIFEVRVVRTNDLSLKDQIEILFPNPLTGINQWYPITEKSNPLEQGTADRYYMDTFFDTNLNPALSRRNSRLVWVNGTKTIFSWAGGVNPITSVIPGVGITGNVGKSWISMGFPHFYSLNSIFPGTLYVLINGLKYAVSATGSLLALNTIVGNFEVGDIVTGSISGATGKVVSISSTTIFLSTVSGIFINLDSIVGSISTATANISSATTQDAGWDSDTLLLSSTDALSVGDIATAYIYPPATVGIPYQDTTILPDSYPDIDFCRQNKNYMFYGSFKSKELFMSNNFGRSASEAITFNSSRGLIDGALNDLVLPTIPDFTGTGTVIFRITIAIGDPSVPNSYIFTATDGSGNVSGNSTPFPITQLQQTLKSQFGSISFSFPQSPGITGYTAGDYWEITATQAVGFANSPLSNQIPNLIGPNPEAWANFFFTLPRSQGQGYVWFLAANFNTMEPQEDSMYVNDQYGNWGYIDTILNASAQTETINFTPLKQDSSSKVLYPYLVSHMDNSLIFLTDDKNLNEILRKELVELPQIGYLSEPVSLDFQNLTFHNGSMEYVGKRLFITSPEDDFMMVYDDKIENKYWQPPQSYAENGILSVVENTLISHSNLRNQTFNLFTGTDDDGAEYTVNAVSPANAWGDRWGIKAGNKSFLEGYYGGGPVLKASVYLGINGEQRIITHVVDPIFNPLAQESTEQAPLGEGNIASHQLGSDLPQNPMPHFNEIWTSYDPIMQFYFVAFGISCVGTEHTYEILSMGINSVPSALGNSELIPEEIISKI